MCWFYTFFTLILKQVYVQPHYLPYYSLCGPVLKRKDGKKRSNFTEEYFKVKIRYRKHYRFYNAGHSKFSSFLFKILRPGIYLCTLLVVGTLHVLFQFEAVKST